MSYIYRIILLSLAVLSVNACGQKTDDRMFSYGPDRKSDIVYFFKKGTTNDQINDFIETKLANPHPGGGHWPIDGIKGTFMLRKDDYEGSALTLTEGITGEERSSIHRILNTSPIVYRVFENVTPDEIDLESIEKDKNKPSGTKDMKQANKVVKKAEQ